MGLCGCNLKEKLECSNGIHDGKNWHQIRISRSGERQKICRIVAMKIRGNILCSGELGGLCCRWNVCHQNLDMIDELKHLPGAWIKKTFHYCIIRRSEVTWGLLFIMSRYCSRKYVDSVCVLKFRSAPKTAATFPRTLWSLVSVQLCLSKLREQYF